MGKHVSPKSLGTSFCNLLVLLALLLQTCSNLAKAGSIVSSLPGFEGPLPFELETGYIGVGESEDVQLFYYFVKSESNPETDPLILWLTGGPGCSSFSGLVFEIGPIKFEPFLYDGSLPKLILNSYSWTKVASIIFVDQPVGTGFSYAKTARASLSTTLKDSNQLYEFLKKWLLDHREFIANPFYVAGDSYGGVMVPIVSQLISNGNEVEAEPIINLKGYMVGNPGTTQGDGNYVVPHAHGLGLISNELYQSLKDSCKGEYQRIDPRNALCLQHMQTYNQLLSGINYPQILERNCPAFWAGPTKKFGEERSTIEIYSQKIQELGFQERAPITCRMEGYKLAYHWSNDKNVQEALHVREGSIGEWERCNRSLSFMGDVESVVPYHANLSIKGYRSLVYSGDHDMIIPYLATQAWIKSLNYQIIDDWRQWIVEDQVAGYTRTYANKMTFATVKARIPSFFSVVSTLNIIVIEVENTMINNATGSWSYCAGVQAQRMSRHDQKVDIL
ncbi:OLC1v1016892C1 [Oldenlandia corymbosa var. corymbosa]|uniref:OLC1v1016892C1 n=1 Tax=Oldenlandia corymbosa var. corymbosa TaxID=529605 RepID=A0AAV1E858_OLDCO|nr:OLC1v1016892C1 [Oldenlandia corymbosa var. corymbosa]